ncbi:soluble lytic murein transglycosylase [Candidatus Magnetobacterium bavaricum]|uniref:Soluble lytic murein transglycosylase n=1 Tax=Candidatus Magnetobacterium bavaricum TaxID=29290 RepID=A0A0F3H0N1_9BACT|nr:soluble lytic murein transglycosylase [Candidatus Magnetobacterium bavaricum]
MGTPATKRPFLSFLLLLFLFLFLLSSAGQTWALAGAYGHLKGGKTALDGKDFDGAIRQLSLFLETPALLEDYALLWRAKGYAGAGQPEKALKDILHLKESYPNSPLYKDALLMEITTQRQLNPEQALALSELYLKKHPDDNRIRFSYANMLTEDGREGEALAQFKRICLSAGAASEQSCDKINVGRLDVNELVTRAKNLMKKHHYSDAEALLRRALDRSTGALRTQILQDIAISLFRQKSYNESAELFHKLGNAYYETRSLYRSGQFDKFNAKVDTLDANKDEKSAELVLIKGLYYRRLGKTARALKIFASLKENRFLKEEALWHIAWAHYLTGDYEEAHEGFKSLHSNYGDQRYLYWMARTLELNKGDATSLYERLTKEGDYYSLLTYYKLGRQPALIEPVEIKHTISLNGNPGSGKDHEELRRLAVLLELNIEDAIKTESLHIIRNADKYNNEVMLEAGMMLNEAHMYRHSVLLAGKLPYSRKVHRLLYPYAYRDIVDEASHRNSINPLLILSLTREESRFQDDAFSPAGAIGLMQLMPSTAAKYSGKVGERISDKRDLFNVRKNILIGSYYLTQLVGESGCVPMALASYNAGESAVEKWLRDGKYAAIDEFIEDIPYDETRNYVKRVLKTYFQYTRASNPDNAAVSFVLNCSLAQKSTAKE